MHAICTYFVFAATAQTTPWKRDQTTVRLKDAASAVLQLAACHVIPDAEEPFRLLSWPCATGSQESVDRSLYLAIHSVSFTIAITNCVFSQWVYVPVRRELMVKCRRSICGLTFS